jgi:protein involved in polysaccharide export with SLBB domain
VTEGLEWQGAHSPNRTCFIRAWVRSGLHAGASVGLRRARPRGLAGDTWLPHGSPARLPAILAMSAALVGGTHLGLARGQSSAAETAAVAARPAPLEAAAPEATPGTTSGIYLVDVGDRLKISIYGRDDLTAEYRIQDDGKVRVPTLGAFLAAGRAATDLEGVIRNAAEQALRRQCHVTVDVVERRPIFVVGLVAKPGSYPFSPGMTVIHATAVAGGTMSTAAAAWLPTEALREGARLVTAKEELKRLLARQARLRAERDSVKDIAMPPELVEAAGADEAGQLVADEQSVHERQLAGLERQRDTLNLSILEAKNEVGAYERELASIGEQRKVRQAAFDTVQSLSKQGLTTLQRLTDAELLLANIDRDAQGAIANIARSKQNLARAERDLALLTIDTKIRIDKDLQTVGEQIAKAYAAMEGSAKVIHHAAGLPALLLTQEREPQFRYEVLRKNGQGRLAAVPAMETTPLLPGDVVRISVVSSR